MTARLYRMIAAVDREGVSLHSGPDTSPRASLIPVARPDGPVRLAHPHSLRRRAGPSHFHPPAHSVSDYPAGTQPDVRGQLAGAGHATPREPAPAPLIHYPQGAQAPLSASALACLALILFGSLYFIEVLAEAISRS